MLSQLNRKHTDIVPIIQPIDEKSMVEWLEEQKEAVWRDVDGTAYQTIFSTECTAKYIAQLAACTNRGYGTPTVPVLSFSLDITAEQAKKIAEAFKAGIKTRCEKMTSRNLASTKQWCDEVVKLMQELHGKAEYRDEGVKGALLPLKDMSVYVAGQYDTAKTIVESQSIDSIRKDIQKELDSSLEKMKKFKEKIEECTKQLQNLQDENNRVNASTVTAWEQFKNWIAGVTPESQKAERDAARKTLESKIGELKADIKKLDQGNWDLQVSLQSIERKIDDDKKATIAHENEVAEWTTKVNTLKDELHAKDEVRAELETKNSTLTMEMEKLQHSINQLTEQREELNEEYAKLEKEGTELDSANATQKTSNEGMKVINKKLVKELEELTLEVTKQKAQNATLKSDIEKAEEEARRLAKKEQELKNKQQILNNDIQKTTEQKKQWTEKTQELQSKQNILNDENVKVEAELDRRKIGYEADAGRAEVSSLNAVKRDDGGYGSLGDSVDGLDSDVGSQIGGVQNVDVNVNDLQSLVNKSNGSLSVKSKSHRVQSASVHGRADAH